MHATMCLNINQFLATLNNFWQLFASHHVILCHVILPSCPPVPLSSVVNLSACKFVSLWAFQLASLLYVVPFRDYEIVGIMIVGILNNLLDFWLVEEGFLMLAMRWKVMGGEEECLALVERCPHNNIQLYQLYPLYPLCPLCPLYQLYPLYTKTKNSQSLEDAYAACLLRKIQFEKIQIGIFGFCSLDEYSLVWR